MTTKELYAVSIETTILVVAESEAAARRHAMGTIRDLESHEFFVDASQMSSYPPGWDDRCIPYGDGDRDEPGRTVGGWMAAGAAPLIAKVPK